MTAIRTSQLLTEAYTMVKQAESDTTYGREFNSKLTAALDFIDDCIAEIDNHEERKTKREAQSVEEWDDGHAKVRFTGGAP